MIKIFLSRPTWVAPEFEDGLEKFIKFLRSQGFDPRTIGTTDKPIKSPMDEVIDLMDTCQGAIILGYPQVVATAGSVKNKTIDSALVISTEWNHIETGLAFAKKMPILLVHDPRIDRGVFSRGAVSGFLHAVDFRDPAWALSDGISGAIEAWKKKTSDFKIVIGDLKTSVKPAKPFAIEVSEANIFVNREAFIAHLNLVLQVHGIAIPNAKINSISADISLGSNGFIKCEKFRPVIVPYSNSVEIRFEENLNDLLLKRAESIFSGTTSVSSRIDFTIQYEVESLTQNLFDSKCSHFIWREIKPSIRLKLSEEDKVAVLADWAGKTPWGDGFGLIKYSELDSKLGLDSGDTKRLIETVITRNHPDYSVDTRGENFIRFKYRGRPGSSPILGRIDLSQY